MDKLEQNLVVAKEQETLGLFSPGEIVAIVNGNLIFIAPTQSETSLKKLNHQIADYYEKPLHRLEEDNITIFTIADLTDVS